MHLPVSVPSEDTHLIPLRPGNIHGDRLAPSLYRLHEAFATGWLHINGREFRCACSTSCSANYAIVLAAADDPALPSGSVHQLQQQLDKVQAFEL